ncbi:hypothetical protein C7M61_004137 [Candidozyma pseudohaemuli]|uniref:Rapamycin-insensitive companion of mTOR N-terminal domain-containing protein n=1 Tax=Candidozyma pseudohaemuli TaxID=418784 RepID=A0A2P7YK06_9ASCO|nr:hypothetical protein C7M61_004137 [[Candida] pseudohaemulonii]PSK36313.1 hypothetical protein C7M61_004137 [[Candida] pseudohaemulonii]
MPSEDQPPGRSPLASFSPDPLDKASFSPSNESRIRSYTLDSLNISSIESSKGPHQRSENSRQKNLPEQNVEAASWTFTEILQNLSVREKDDVYLVITKCNQLVELLQDTPSLKHDMAIDMVVNRIQFMFYHPAPQLRCAAYRVLRYSIASLDSILLMVQLKILISIIVSLSVPCPLLEKQEALKLIREFLNVSDGANFISVGVIKALVAIIEHDSEDDGNTNAGAPAPQNDQFAIPTSFTKLCIETICEIAVLKPHIVFHGGGLRLMMSLIINGASDIATSCLVVFMSILDKPEARLFLRNGLDLTSLTSVYSLVDEDDESKLSNSRKFHNRALKVTFLISVFLKCWTGIICFSHNNFEAIRIIISKLKGKSNKVRNIIMDLLLDVLRIQALPWLEDSSIFDLITSMHVFLSPGGELVDELDHQYLDIPPNSFEKTVISHYQGLILQVLLSCGVVPLIFDIIDKSNDESVSSKATFLLTNILRLSMELLPREFVQEQLSEAAAKEQMKTVMTEKKRGEVKSHVKDMIIENRVKMDDAALKTLISRTRILNLKDFEDWDWAQMSHLCQGPLRDQKRFFDIQEKYPKVLRYLMSFFRPFKYRFSRAPLRPDDSYKLKHPKRVILVGCQLIEALLHHEAGFEYLASNKLMPQLAEIFAQVSPNSGIRADEPILSTKKLETTLSIGYVKFVGVLSASNKGLMILEEWQFFQLISDIIDGNADSNSNVHLLFNLLNNLNFVLDSPLRILLSKVLTISNEGTKLFTLENVIPKLLKVEGCQDYVIRSLANLLYDESKAVVALVVSYLHDYYVVKGNISRINLFIDMRPSTLVLSKHSKGKELLLLFCTTTTGFRLLHENGLIQRHLVLTTRSLQSFEYLESIEGTLKMYLYPFSSILQRVRNTRDINCHHFFYYLLSTEEGFIYFNSQRAILDDIINKTFFIVQKLRLIEEQPATTKAPDFLYSRTRPAALESSSSKTNSIGSDESDDLYKLESPNRLHARSDLSFSHTRETLSETLNIKTAEDEEEYMLMRLKQYLWILGEIASSKYGIQILDPLYNPDMRGDHVIELMHLLYQNSREWQIRGIAFHQLGKMAATNEGIEMLDDMNWISIDNRSPLDPLYLAYPESMRGEDLFNLEVLNPYEDSTYISLFGNHGDEIWANQQLDLDADDGLGLQTNQKLDDKALSLINHLSSVLGKIERKATKELNSIKLNNGEIFESPIFFLKTIRLVDKGKFKYKTRNFIFGLFDTVKIMETLVKRSKRGTSGRK